MKDDRYYTTMGQVLFEKTQQAQERVIDGYPEKGTKKSSHKANFINKMLSMVENNDYALAHLARRYEENVQNSDDPELLFQLENIVIEVRGRLGLEDPII